MSLEEFQVDFYMSSGKVYSIIYTQESIEKVREIVDNLIEFSPNITYAEEGDRITVLRTSQISHYTIAPTSFKWKY